MAFPGSRMPAVTANPERARRFAIDVVSHLRAAGHQALWAGGCVRDELLGRTPADYDVATSAPPATVRELFGRRRTLEVGAAFGVMTIVGPRDAGHVEVTTFRTDAAYTDGRHPAGVIFSTPEHDAQRRDFTINGLFFDPLTGQVHDYVGGQADLERGIVRAIGVAAQRFAEDHLRMLRAVRFAAGFGFALEARTQAAVERMASLIKNVSPERIASELRLMVSRPGRSRALEMLFDLHLAAEIIPEIAIPNGSPIPRERWRQASLIVGSLDEANLPAALATLVDISKADDLPMSSRPTRSRRCQSITVAAIGSRLRLSNDEESAADWLLAAVRAIQQIDSGGDVRTAAWSSLQPWLIDARAHAVADLMRARAGHGLGSSTAAAWVTSQLERPPHELNPPPLLTGRELLDAGVAAGPGLGRLLSEVRQRQLDGEISTTTEAIAWVKKEVHGSNVS